MNAHRPALRDPRWFGVLVGALAALHVLAFFVAPVLTVFVHALRDGPLGWLRAITAADTALAVRTTLLVAALSVPVNVVAGVLAAWYVTRFRPRYRTALLLLMDLPLAMSPVVAGLLVVLVYGSQGLLGPWLRAHGLQVVFALPGLVIATIFVTLPYVARILLPVMDQQSLREEEEAARILGADFLAILRRVTLPAVGWALLYGTVLTTCRAVGEFGAVSVVSGSIRGQTTTMPLQIEILHNEYQSTPAFALASLLTLVALSTLLAKALWLRPAPVPRADGGTDP